MNFEEAFSVADAAVFANTGKHLTDVEKGVLEGSCDSRSYTDIANTVGYSENYIQRDVGRKLWEKLSRALGEQVSKTNFRSALERYLRRQPQPEDTLPPVLEFEHPDNGYVPLNSPFYVQGLLIESLCYETILKPASLIRIKAPNLMGKTSLTMRILAHASQTGYRTVYLDFGSVEVKVLTNLNRFLRWLCWSVGKQIDLENQLQKLWDTEISSSNDNCTGYFDEYLLPEIGCQLVLGLDAVDRIFLYPEVAKDFFSMLRSWHEKGKIDKTWGQMRLMLAYSTEVYVQLDTNQSPFNVGVIVELPEFDQHQVLDLAKQHRLDWQDIQVGKLWAMVGGHPYLVRLALYHVGSQMVTLEQLLQTASTEAGIYSNHLRRHLENLQVVPELAEALKQVVSSPNPVELNPMQTYKLYSLGLVQQQDNSVTPRCNLYREYFSRVLK